MYLGRARRSIKQDGFEVTRKGFSILERWSTNFIDNCSWTTERLRSVYVACVTVCVLYILMALSKRRRKEAFVGCADD